MNDAGSGFCFAAAQGEVHVVQKPAEKVHGIGLVEEIEAFVGLAGDLLEKLMGGDVGFKGARVPYFPDED